MNKKRIAVIGVGSAGIQSLATLLPALDSSWEVYSIHNPNKPALGIGESSNPSFLAPLSRGLDFDITRDLELLDGTLKFGTEYVNWRSHSFTNPFVEGSLAIHFNTNSLKDFAMNRFKSLWPNKFVELHGNVSNIKNIPNGVEAYIDDEVIEFDYVIDCSGFPKNFEEYVIAENMPVNYCIVYNKMNSNKSFGPYYTEHLATKDGWTFVIPLTTRTSYGYLFNESITDIRDARQNFAEMLGINLLELGNIEYKFKPYYAKNIFNDRIIKNGNSAAFFEPMFGNSLRLYSLIDSLIKDYILKQKTAAECNKEYLEWTTDIEHLINYHYLGGSLYNTPFWDFAKNISIEKINKYNKIKILSSLLKSQEKRDVILSEPLWFFSPQGLNYLDKNLGYKYFTDKEIT